MFRFIKENVLEEPKRLYVINSLVHSYRTPIELSPQSCFPIQKRKLFYSVQRRPIKLRICIF